MSIPEEATGSHHDPLDAVIAAYLQQVEAGVVPDREALLAQHPDLADSLREFFADFDRRDRQAGELHLPGAATESVGERPHVRYFGEYELLEVIARGGMGVVYKARQQSLNRLVALKMILHGQLATPRAVARFRAEAEAAANLDHQHIVPIHEVGEHQGQQYFTMRFIEGPSLARQPRGDLCSEVRLVATVAQAVHYAHQHGILHRDLKPSNILVADGMPFVTDFGLAKRLDGAGDLTGTGETPGTPRYMAPEQAAGRRDLTVAADVYSLGVVLYERLAGTTPFCGDDVLEVLRQVREAEPLRPSVVRPGLDRDLETICLKCLEKEPAKRYSSAETLAEDLERWLRGEPILARPVGSLGRLRRWCRRNRAVAGLTGTVAVALLAGTVISIYFAIQADQRATAEQTERERAQAAEARMEQAVVRSLVRPMNADAVGVAGTAGLNPMELEALWELARTTEPSQRLRFLAGMFATEANVNQLRNRLDWVVHSAVGLDPQLREQAERLLMEAMHDPEKSLRHRTRIAWAVMELSEAGSASQRASVAVIAQGWAAEEDEKSRDAWREHLLERAERMVPGEARLLTQALEKETISEYRDYLADGLVAVASRLEPTEATRIGTGVLRSLLPRLNLDPNMIHLGYLEVETYDFKAVSTLLQTLDVGSVEPLVLTLSRQIASTGNSDAGALEILLTHTTRLSVRRRTAALIAAVGTGAGGPLSGLPFLPAAREPLPCRLATHDLVDLLKLPTCVRQVRRVILDQLGHRYGRRFDTHWDFVRYAQEQRLDLDFTTPPKRPEAKLPRLFEE